MLVFNNVPGNPGSLAALIAAATDIGAGIDNAADYLFVLDTSTGLVKKVTPSQLGGAAYQAADNTLTQLAAANWAANAIPIGSGSDTVAQVSFAANTFPARASTGDLVAKPITDFGLSLVDDADQAAAQVTLGLVPGTNVQVHDATLAALAALTIAANSLTIGTGADTFSQTTFAANTFPARASTGDLVAKPITDFGLSIAAAADGPAVRTLLGIDTDDAVTFGDVTVNNLVVNGTTLTVNTATITVDDPLIALGDGNGADSVDLGFYATYTSGGTKYAGLFRDATDGKFKAFTALEELPTTTVNVAGTGYTVATIVANLEGNVTGNVTGNLTGNVTGTLTGNADTVTVADAGADTTCWVMLATSQTGSLAPATDGGLTYNANTNALTATTFIGALTGNASTATALATARSIYGNNFDGTGDLAQIIASTFGGTGNGFAKFSGPTTAEKTFTLPDATCTILTTDAAVTIAQGGTGAATAAAARVALLPAIASNALKVLRVNAGETDYELATVSGGGLSDGDYGDITVSGTGTVMTIDNNVVSLAKMATMATASLLGRNTAGTGNVEVLSASTARTLLGLATTDAVTFGDLTVSNLVVNGTTTTVNSTTMTVDDPLIALGDGNGADSVDLGWYGTYTATGAKYTGFFRDASDGKYKLFTALESAPTSTVDTGGTGYTIATLVCALEATASANFTPTTNDGAALGTTALGWSDLHLATGAVINYANGNVVMTHSSGILTMGTGELRITTPGTNGASVPTLGSISTFTDKRITKRVQSVTDAATITPNADSDDVVDVTAIAQAFTLANPSGTPTNMQMLEVCVKDNGTGRAITYGTDYVEHGITKKATTTASKKLSQLWQYRTANSLNKWVLMAQNEDA